MFCRNCSKEVAQNAEVCLACGVRPSNGTKFCNGCGVETNPNQELCVKCGVRLAGSSGISTQGENTIMIILSYLGILCLIPLLTQKQNKFVMFHAKQGLALFIACIILWVVQFIFVFIPFIGWIISLLMMFVWLGVLIMVIMGIVNGIQGKEWKMPVIGGFAEKLNF